MASSNCSEALRWYIGPGPCPTIGPLNISTSDPNDGDEVPLADGLATNGDDVALKGRAGCARGKIKRQPREWIR